MNPIVAQLMEAYGQQHQLYRRIRDLAGAQLDIMQARPDPGAVLRLCNQLELLMAEVDVIEAAIEPAKRYWLDTRRETDPELDALLGEIQSLIEQTAGAQAQVQQRVLDFAHRQEEHMGGARTTVTLNRARAVYHLAQGAE